MLSSKKQRDVISVLMAGADLATAADYVGRTLEEIQDTAAKRPRFKARIERAEPDFELAQLGNITKAALREQYWRAAAWLLERKFPNQYAKADPSALAPTKVRAILNALAKLVLDEVPDQAARVRIVERLTRLLDAIEAAEK